MPSPTPRRLALLAVVAVAAAPFLRAGGDKEVKSAAFAGRVVPLAGLVEKLGTKLDPDAAPTALVLAGDDGTVYPLIKDEGARMFFTDARLLKRPMSLTGRLLPGSQLLQVLRVHSVVKGVPHEVYYWCDICSIKRYEKMICECCGMPMEFREVPAAK